MGHGVQPASAALGPLTAHVCPALVSHQGLCGTPPQHLCLTLGSLQPRREENVLEEGATLSLASLVRDKGAVFCLPRSLEPQLCWSPETAATPSLPWKGALASVLPRLEGRAPSTEDTWPAAPGTATRPFCRGGAEEKARQRDPGTCAHSPCIPSLLCPQV